MKWIFVLFCVAVGPAGCSHTNANEGDDGGVDAGEPDGAGQFNDAEVDAGSDPHVWHVDDLNDGLPGTGTESDPFRDLQDAIDAASDGDILFIRVGRYTAQPAPYVDPTCGNCDELDFRQDIQVTVGFLIQGKSLTLRGEDREQTVLETGAGYGVLFENAGTSVVENLTVTGGVRDADGKATSAGIIARHTNLTIRHADVAGNDNLYDGEPDPVAGIIGIAGREGAVLTVYGCRVINNSWDGIALYRGDPEMADSGASATIVNNEIGCTGQCNCWTSCDDTRGRGAGIGVTWDAEAVIINNRIHHYWKGIGSFGTSHVVVTNNVVHLQLGWGVIASGDSYMDAINNVIAENGTTGLAAWNAGASGRFINNIVVGNGWNSEWVGKCTGVWMNAPSSFEFAYNDVWDNLNEDVCSGGVPGGDPCTPIAFEGADGNLSVDPMFVDAADYFLRLNSPVIDLGDPAILDPDNSRSDMGAYGGPATGRLEP
jgi:hypothetical protein